jgi:uracil-DNA glycosylase family protein
MSVPDTTSLKRLAEAAASCTMCELYRDAEQTVFGEGPRPADFVLVGEQPGDVEDREGHVFVGPAGHMLDRVLEEAGFDRSRIYLTNAVKHFRFEPRGKRRLHKRPGATHVSACGPWLAAELRAVRPRVVIALGAVAGQSLFGPKFSVMKSRGTPLPWPPPSGQFAESRLAIEHGFATIHPSAILRGADEDRRTLRQGMIDDLVAARELVGNGTG